MNIASQVPDALRVLLVEDNSTDAMLVCDELEHAHPPLVVTVCSRLEASLALLSHQSFDVVLLDLSLPDSDGLATFSALKDTAPEVPMVVLSHRDDEALALRAVQMGAQDYLIKGHAQGFLLRSVRYAVERAYLQRARLAAEKQLSLLEFSVAHLNDMMLITDANSVSPCIVYVNEAFTRKTGYTSEEAVGRTPSFLQGPKTERAALDRIARALQAGNGVREEIVNYTKTGQEFWLEIDISPLQDTDGVVTHFVAVERDVTERKASDDLRRETEKRLELALSGGSLGYWDWSILEGRLQVSDRWLEMLGLQPDATRDTLKLWQSVVHPDDVPVLQHIVETVFNHPQGTNFEATIRARHAQGHYIWILDKGAVFERTPEGQALRVVGTHLDVSAQKEAELQIEAGMRALEASQHQLQTLSRRILRAQETERRRVALELHDDLGQALTAVKINLMSPASAEGRAPTALEAENIRIMEAALQQVRRIALALRPSMLDDLGLEAALNWLVKSAMAHRDVEINLQCHMASQRIAPEMETSCFRIVQECLTNIRRHARASHVAVTLFTDSDEAVLTVKDDGVGFDMTSLAGRSADGFSLGLLGIEERASNVGGEVSIKTAPGKGCTVEFRCAFDAAPLSTL